MEDRTSFTYLIQTKGAGTIFDPYSIPDVIPLERVTDGADARDYPTKPGLYMVTAYVTAKEHSEILSAGGVVADVFSAEAKTASGVDEVPGEDYVITMKREFLLRQEMGGRAAIAAADKK